MRRWRVRKRPVPAIQDALTSMPETFTGTQSSGCREGWLSVVRSRLACFNQPLVLCVCLACGRKLPTAWRCCWTRESPRISSRALAVLVKCAVEGPW